MQHGEWRSNTLPAMPISELMAIAEMALLPMSSVYRGRGIPRGAGSAVIIIPGLGFKDRSLGELHDWLRRIGYRSYFSGMKIADDCPRILQERLEETVDRALQKTGRRVHLVGYSFGGIIARVSATQNPEKIASVITLGTPFRAIITNSWVLEYGEAIRARIIERRPGFPRGCMTSHCPCAFVSSLSSPWPQSVFQTAIYAPHDGLIEWQCCVTGKPDTDIPVGGTHLGLPFNSEVYRHIARRLYRARDWE